MSGILSSAATPAESQASNDTHRDRVGAVSFDYLSSALLYSGCMSNAIEGISPQPYLTIVIPAYNEAPRIGPTLDRVRAYMASRPYTWELIVVDDGSTDGTGALLSAVAAGFPCMRVLRNDSNRGKGFSVRRGVLEARGELVLFTDADLSSPIQETEKLLQALASSRADSAIGSRALQRELVGVHQPWPREYAGRFFNLLVRLMTGLEISDTQCGLKVFRRKSTRRAFELQRVAGFGFDPELLYLIKSDGGKIVEVPVRWSNDPATKVRFLRDSAKMLWDLLVLRGRVWSGGYRRQSEGQEYCP
jgi:dolichyl-phosphate beta-glucosyltransferase